jgi:hypothetical protein
LTSLVDFTSIVVVVLPASFFTACLPKNPTPDLTKTKRTLAGTDQPTRSTTVKQTNAQPWHRRRTYTQCDSDD